MAATDIPVRDDYRYFVDITTRWQDNDIYGHVNNVVYYAYFDTAANHLLIREGGLGHAGHGQGIGDAQDPGEQGDHRDRRTDLVQHQKTAFRLATARLS